MVESLSQRIVGRVAAVLLLLGGGSAALTAAVPAPNTPRPLALAGVGACAMLLGVFAWFAPWNRWPRRAALWLAPLVFGLIGIGPPIGAGNPYTYGMYFLAVFTWIGMGFPRGTALKISPLAAAAFVLPLVAMSDSMGPAFSALQVIPLCVLVGEALAWMGSRLRHAETVDAARLRAMHGLVESSDRLARETDAGDAAALVARLSVQILRGDGALVLLAEGGDRLAVAASDGWPGDVPAVVASDAGRASSPDLARAIAAGEPIVVRRGPESGPLTRTWPGTLFLPLHGATGSIGAVVVGFRQRTGQLDEFNQNLATTFATQSALTFERLHATRALVDASLQDPLTQVANRRAADQALESVRPGDALALIDIDHFKGVNDSLGHAAGDAALRGFAAFLRRELRADDVVARYGGDEFLLVLPRGGRGAESTLERLRRTWDAGGPVATFSAGVAVHQAGPPAETMTRADEALYRAKARGGDRVVSEAHPSDAPDRAPVPA